MKLAHRKRSLNIGSIIDGHIRSAITNLQVFAQSGVVVDRFTVEGIFSTLFLIGLHFASGNRMYHTVLVVIHQSAHAHMNSIVVQICCKLRIFNISSAIRHHNRHRTLVHSVVVLAGVRTIGGVTGFHRNQIGSRFGHVWGNVLVISFSHFEAEGRSRSNIITLGILHHNSRRTHSIHFLSQTIVGGGSKILRTKYRHGIVGHLNSAGFLNRSATCRQIVRIDDIGCHHRISYALCKYMQFVRVCGLGKIASSNMATFAREGPFYQLARNRTYSHNALCSLL